MQVRKILSLIMIAVFFSGCANQAQNDHTRKRGLTPEASSGYVDTILVEKSKRSLKLIGGGKVLKEYKIALGSNPIGHKQVENDGRTPEGTYTISLKKPNSQFHRSLKISYPNANDIARARGLGQNPGGEIYIHGGPRNNPNFKASDWTRGCIGVTDKEAEEIFAHVRTGTKIVIRP